jgi:serine/threonine protein kinase
MDSKTVITGIKINTTNICLYCLHDTGGTIPCPTCSCETPFNYENPKPEKNVALKPGTILNQAASPILIGRCLGAGGFGITYLGLDVLKKRIVVKEFMPRSVAGRASDALKITAHKGHDETYKYGLQKFVEEARMLAYGNFPEHPNIVTILTLFEENNTAYFTMVYRRGMTLEEYVKNLKGGITQKELLDIMRDVLNGLKAVHKEAIFHRDIKPSNIYIPDKNEHGAFLLDFGSARQAMSGYSLSTISVFLTPGYAPKEQYKKQEKQGPYTDIYACAATMYTCMRGRFNRHGIIVPPPESMEICNGTAKLEPLDSVSKQPVSWDFSRAIDIGLQCEPDKRPQSVAEFEELLGLSSLPHPQLSSGNYELLGIAGKYEGATFPLNEGPLMLGRNPRECNLVISDRKPSRVSSVHCQVYTENGRVYLKDVSRHGTTVNEHDINHTIEELKPNDILNLQGEEVFQIVQSKVEPLTQDTAPPPLITTTPASFLQRFTAWFIDSMVLMVGLLVILFFESFILGIFGIFFKEGSQLARLVGTTGGLVLLATLFLVPWIYNAAMESSFKQATLGKMALGMIVTGMDNKRISFWRASGRYFGKILSSLILMIGFIMPIFTEKKQALHDIIAKCLVVSK